MHCTVCGGTRTSLQFKGEADVYQCADCTHAFSDPNSIAHPENYGPEYYERTHRNWFANPDIELFDWIAGQLPESVRSVLDAGCGKGTFLRFLRDRSAKELKLVGVDLSENKPEHGIEYRQGDTGQIAGDERFDSVVSLAVIEHVDDPVAFARMAASLCNPEGVVVTMTLDNNSLLYMVARAMALAGIRGPALRLYSAHHVQHFSARSLRKVLENAGLTVISTHRHDAPLKALDIPASNKFAKFVFLFGLVVLRILGRLSARTSLQTIVARTGNGRQN